MVVRMALILATIKLGIQKINLSSIGVQIIVPM